MKLVGPFDALRVVCQFKIFSCKFFEHRARLASNVTSGQKMFGLIGVECKGRLLLVFERPKLKSD